MNIASEQVFIVNTTELDQQNQHIATLQRAFMLPGASLQSEETLTSMCLLESMDPPSRNQTCRLCATVTELVVPIFEGEGLQNNLADKIHQHLPIKVSESDHLPVVMCFQCTSTLLAWHELVVCSVQADSIMRERFNVAYSHQQHQQQQEPHVQHSQSEIKDEKCGLAPCKQEYETDDGRAFGPSSTDTDSDDIPLASYVDNKRDAFLKFYDALLRYRDHVASDHVHTESDSSESGAKTNIDVGVEAYDDLSHRNRRVSRMERAAREEISSARTRTEDGRVVYRCSVCGKLLSSAHTLTFHRRIHTGERPCVCHVCGAQFRTAPGLQRHVHETHERRRRQTCHTCLRTFANMQNLKQHMRIHTGERPYECAVCGKTFAASGSLHAHRAVHRAGRPHACTECGAAFRLRAGLARHRLRHSGERPHACRLCPRTFRSRHDAHAHQHTHGDARPHACRLCPATFRLRRALRHHHKRLHGDAELAPTY